MQLSSLALDLPDDVGDGADELDDDASAVNVTPLEGNMPARFMRARSISDVSRVESSYRGRPRCRMSQPNFKHDQSSFHLSRTSNFQVEIVRGDVMLKFRDVRVFSNPFRGRALAVHDERAE